VEARRGRSPAPAVASTPVSAPRVVAVAASSPAARAGLEVGDEILALNGEVPRDVIAYRLLADDADVALDVNRGGLELRLDVAMADGEPLGAEVSSALFDQVRTCDNHCEFCFIYQLPPGMRESLYLKDDDYRLSFLYGNFTTLTRFTEADLERVVSEGLSPLHVSIHATDPDVRAEMLRNRRGATSLRWLRALLDHGIEVHGQVVVCPGRNDGAVLDDTFAGILDRFPELASVCVVPLGVSRHNTETAMRPHTTAEAAAVVDAVHDWQDLYLATLGRRLVFAADEYYLLAGAPFPEPDAYEGFPMHEDGVGMARTFELEFGGEVGEPTGVATGFFAWVDGAPAEGYRAPRDAPTSPSAVAAAPGSVALRPRRSAPVGVLTGTYGAKVLGPLVEGLGRDDVRVVEVENRFFGGNTGVAGLMVGSDLARVLAAEPEGHRYLLPDVCLSQGRFLDGTTPGELPRPVEVVATDGLALRAALEPA
jgi:putative radical SAM enzyme (TIGR03279 family)